MMLIIITNNDSYVDALVKTGLLLSTCCYQSVVVTYLEPIKVPISGVADNIVHHVSYKRSINTNTSLPLVPQDYKVMLFQKRKQKQV